jgi:formylmethanofuran dehydrogenase subunit D
MKKIAILMSVLMLVTLTSGMALAKGKKATKMKILTGEVVKVDAQAGTIVIKAKKKERTLKAEPKLIEGIAAGEKVTVEMTGDTLNSIKKVEAPAMK